MGVKGDLSVLSCSRGSNMPRGRSRRWRRADEPGDALNCALGEGGGQSRGRYKDGGGTRCCQNVMLYFLYQDCLKLLASHRSFVAAVTKGQDRRRHKHES